jgi:YebC/PmpR family DNA-binding regulatory protein
MAIQNAKDVQMPKDKVEAAIKRAVSREEKDFEEMTYEGYGPHGVAIMVECATENNNRTVANLRTIFNKNGGALGTNGSVAFMFERKGIFVLENKPGQSVDDIELDLIDAGAEDIHIDDEGIIVTCEFEDFGGMQKSLEDRQYSIKSSVLQRIPTNYKEVTEAEEEALNKLLEKLDEDEDVQNVFHNMQLVG